MVPRRWGRIVTGLVAEFRAIPWNARGRRIGRLITGTLIFVMLMAPLWIEGLVYGLVGR